MHLALNIGSIELNFFSVAQDPTQDPSSGAKTSHDTCLKILQIIIFLYHSVLFLW